MSETKFFQDAHMDTINALTRYPSIPDLHACGPGGRLLDKPTVALRPRCMAAVQAVGLNMRLIVHRSDWVLGCGDQLIAARGDRLQQDGLGVVGPLLKLARDHNLFEHTSRYVYVFYFEAYASKHPSKFNPPVGTPWSDPYFKLFDAQWLKRAEWLGHVGRLRPAQASSWSAALNQHWTSYRVLRELYPEIPMPRIFDVATPTSPAEVRDLLAALAPGYDGLVLRDQDLFGARSNCVKVQHNYYKPRQAQATMPDLMAAEIRKLAPEVLVPMGTRVLTVP